ncbi:MAG: flagellar biosynthetic protein FliR [Burkholderiaceae bacterium]|nr:flagellar biosynthetic protein FliR [Burkholderiaceae bacterium]
MTQDLLLLNDSFMRWAALVMLFLIKPAIAFEILPATNEPMLLSTPRRLLTVSIAVFAGTGAWMSGWRVPPLDTLWLLALREAALGFTIGFAAAQVFWIAQGVGAMVDNVAGYNNVQITNPSSSEQTTPISDVMLQLSVALFWALGGMLLVAGALFESWRWFPMQGREVLWPRWREESGIDEFSGIMRAIASVAAPLLFLVAAIDVGGGLVSRAAKSVDTSALGTPLKAAAAVLSLAIFSAVFAQDIRSYLAMNDLLAMVRQLTGVQ